MFIFLKCICVWKQFVDDDDDDDDDDSPFLDTTMLRVGYDQLQPKQYQNTIRKSGLFQRRIDIN